MTKIFEEKLLFVIDTEQYAGDFERQMTAYLTGIVGECGVGKEEALIYRNETKQMCIGRSNRTVEDGIDVDSDLESDLVCLTNDYVNELVTDKTRRPCEVFATPGWYYNGFNYYRYGNEAAAEAEAVAENCTFKKYPAFLSVAIHLRREPTEEEVAALNKRADEFTRYMEIHPDEFVRQRIRITGSRLVRFSKLIHTSKEWPNFRIGSQVGVRGNTVEAPIWSDAEKEKRKKADELHKPGKVTGFFTDETFGTIYFVDFPGLNDVHFLGYELCTVYSPE